MKKFSKIFSAITFFLLVISSSYALTLQEAKADGLVGEQRDGFVGLVVSNASPEVQVIVRDVNAQRRQRYQEIAQENGISVEQVAAVAYERAVQATQSGHYIQNASGAWVRK
ncbi:MAG: DUF1318 domain-containing protein [Pseudomonadales bacterium]|nr:DUF1318 domain-containing protein [Pseudomonadales bacterium]